MDTIANGEVFKGFKWTFTTPTMLKSIAMQGDATVLVLAEDGTLKMRGMEYLSTNVANGSFTFKDWDKMTDMASDVESVCGGYNHRLVFNGTSVSGSGFAMCGETSSKSGISAISVPKLVKAGFQTSAIIDSENSLWMSGRNDFYQLAGGSGTTSKSFIKVLDNIADIALGNGYTLYVDTDNVLWGVGRNHMGQLGDGTEIDRREPVKIMENVIKAYASTSGYFSGCLTADGMLLTWGDNSVGQLGREAGRYSSTPGEALSNVKSASLGEKHALAVTEDFKLYSWGSNANNQISDEGTDFDQPTLIKENIKEAVAGPFTTLILGNSGRVTGQGLKCHNNFGSGSGNAIGFIVDEGLECLPLKSVQIKPSRFEVEPENTFAIVAITKPMASDFDYVEWTSDNPEIASVDGNGVIHSNGIGEAIITVTFTDRFGISKTADAVIVCTENPDNSEVNSGLSKLVSDWHAYSSDTRIVIDNATIGADYNVYNAQGMLLGSRIADRSNIEFSIPGAGVYIVKSGTKTIKILCR